MVVTPPGAVGVARPFDFRLRGVWVSHIVAGVRITGSRAAVLAACLVAATVSAAAPAAPEQDWAHRALAGMSLREKVAQLFVVEVWGSSGHQPHPRNKREYGVATPAQVVREYDVGGVVYFNNSGTDNVDNPRQVAALSNGLQRAALYGASKVPLTIGIDQEGGSVTRIAGRATEYPSAMATGASRDVEGAKRAAAISAGELRAMGITQNFAPVADVNSNPLNPVIGTRSFAGRPDLASRMVAAQVRGYEHADSPGGGVSAAVKHFPGHGDAAVDSHSGLPVIDRSEWQWRRVDLPPFRAAIDAGVDAIMTAHIAVPSLDPSGDPATLSKPIITGILRQELGYDGVVITDSLGMRAVHERYPDSEIPVRAIEAGVDRMLMPNDLGGAIDAVVNAVASGRISEQRIDRSVLRILELKYRRGVVADPYVDLGAVDARVGNTRHRQAIQRLADQGPTLLRDNRGLVPLQVPEASVLVTGWSRPDYPGYPAEPVDALARQLGTSVTALPTGASPSAGEIERARESARQSELVVVLTNGLRTSSAQRELVRELRAGGTPVIAVAVGGPYDAGYATEVGTWLATYGWRDPTMAALAKVLDGAIPAQGKLSVDVPLGSDPDTILYPFGHGLRQPG